MSGLLRRSPRTCVSPTAWVFFASHSSKEVKCSLTTTKLVPISPFSLPAQPAAPGESGQLPPRPAVGTSRSLASGRLVPSARASLRRPGWAGRAHAQYRRCFSRVSSPGSRRRPCQLSRVPRTAARAACQALSRPASHAELLRSSAPPPAPANSLCSAAAANGVHGLNQAAPD